MAESATSEVVRTSGRGMSRASGLQCPACGGLPNLKVKATPLMVPMGERTDVFLRYPCATCRKPVDVAPDQIRRLVRVTEVGKVGNAVDRIDTLMDTLEGIASAAEDPKEVIAAARAFSALAKDKPAIIKALEEDRKTDPQQVLYGDVVMSEGGPIHRTLQTLARAVAGGSAVLPVKEATFTPPVGQNAASPPSEGKAAPVPVPAADEALAW